MSRTYKDEIQQSRSRHSTAPYWVYHWWFRHGKKRTSAQIRRLRNRQHRARARDDLVNEQEPFRQSRGLTWIYW